MCGDPVTVSVDVVYVHVAVVEPVVFVVVVGVVQVVCAVAS